MDVSMNSTYNLAGSGANAYTAFDVSSTIVGCLLLSGLLLVVLWKPEFVGRIIVGGLMLVLLGLWCAVAWMVISTFTTVGDTAKSISLETWCWIIVGLCVLYFVGWVLEKFSESMVYKRIVDYFKLVEAEK